MNKIPNELSARFADPAGRRELIEKYGDSKDMYFGENADGEEVAVSIDKENGIILKTNQHNGWIRVNYYDKDGIATGKSFDGRWREST